MKATEQYFPVVLFIMLYKVIRTFESVDEILKCNHSTKCYMYSDFIYVYQFSVNVQNSYGERFFFFPDQAFLRGENED